MLQHWLNIAGLTFDFLGVLLLSYEWWVAMKWEQKETELAEREARFKPNPMVPKSNDPSQAMFDYMNERRRFHEQVQRAREARGTRRGYYVTALLLISSGFLLQILGSLPGGIGL